jgi:hypothetical protein
MTTTSPRLPCEIDAHLMLAALEGVCVSLSQGRDTVRGRFDLPDDFGEVGFVAESARELTRRWTGGEEVVARYHVQDQPFQFRSRVRSRSSEWRLRLDRPRSLASVERRLSPRVSLAAGGAVLRLDEGAVTVVDLSNQGAQLRWPEGLACPRVGARRPAWLESELTAPIALDIEVRRVEGVLLGVAFRGMRPVDLRDLTRALYRIQEAPTEDLVGRAAG